MSKYSAQDKPGPAVGPGEFVFSAAHLDQAHIYGQCNGPMEAGADLRWVSGQEALIRQPSSRRLEYAGPAGERREVNCA